MSCKECVFFFLLDDLVLPKNLVNEQFENCDCRSTKHFKEDRIALLPASNVALVLGIQCISCTDRTNQTAGTKT